MQVIDNFLSEYVFTDLTDTLLSAEFPWYYNEYEVYPNDDNILFTHTLHTCKGIPPYSDIDYSSRYYNMLKPIFYKLGVRKLVRCKANLNPRTFSHKMGEFHIDNCLDSKQSGKTAILYLNTNNGWTEFKKGGKVKSVANRVVIFDPTLEHRAVTCTDEKRRIVINFNYDV